MIKTFTILKLCLLITAFLVYNAAFSQVSIQGQVTESSSNEPLAGVSIQVKGKVIGTITDSKGNYSLNTTTNPPFFLIISSVGFQNQEIEVSGSVSKLDIKLTEQVILGRESLFLLRVWKRA